MNTQQKRENGIFYTKNNPFNCSPFYTWANMASLPKSNVLEPFAGANHLIEHLKSLNMINSFTSYDINPSSIDVIQRDTLKDFPKGYDVCITNPPWLAKNIATFRGLSFPKTEFDDLYKYSIDKCLNNCSYVAAIIPESYIKTGLFFNRLYAFISLTNSMFSDTTHPASLALFVPEKCEDTLIYSGKNFVGYFSELSKQIPVSKQDLNIKFNDPNGNIGLVALDNTKEPSIRFCPAEELRNYTIKNTGRHITKLSTPFDVNILHCNEVLNAFRVKTKDIFLTSYRGVRQDGMYRRRLDWQLARGIIEYAK